MAVAASSPITLRRATAQDAAALARLMGDPGVYPGLLQLPYATEERYAAWLAEMLQPGKPDLLLLALRDGAVVGQGSLHPPLYASPRRRHAMLLGMAVLPSAQRQGVGRALMQGLCDYADRWAQVLRIELTVFVDNAAAIALYRGFGFEIEGTHRAYALRDGIYTDVHAMARLHPAAPRLPERSA